MQNNSIIVCLVQLAVIPYKFQENKNKIEKYVEKVMKLKKCKPDIIVLPEMWNIGYTINRIEEYADMNGEKTKHFLTELANKHKVIIIGGSIASYNTYKKIYENLNMNIDIEGNLLNTYSKIHLFSPSKEDSVFTRGSQFNVITTTINKNRIKSSTSDSNETNNTSDSNEANSSNSKLECTFSTVICYDIRFPEFIRSIALKGINLKNQKNNKLNEYSKQQLQQPQQDSSSTETTTTIITSTTTSSTTKTTTTKTTTTNSKKNSDTNTKSITGSTSNLKPLEGGLDILFVSAAWPYPRLHHWKSLLIARAIENQCFVVAVNNCGEMDGLTFCGHSLIIDPWGEILIEGEGPKDPLLLETVTNSNSNNNNNNNNNNNDNDNNIKYKEKIENENQLVNGQKAFDEILISSLSFDILKDIRQRICVFNDRFPEVYCCN